MLHYYGNRMDNNHQVLPEQNTKLFFSGFGEQRIIDRVATLTARTDVLMKDVKDGLPGMRVTRALQMLIHRESVLLYKYR